MSKRNKTNYENDCLLLDTAWRPLRFVSYQRAISLHRRGVVDLIDTWPSKGSKHVLPAVLRLREDRSRFMPSRLQFSKNVIFNRDKWRCAYCGDPVNSKSATIDHIKPRSLGGENSWLNCITSCLPCNAKKGASTLEESGLTMKFAKPKIPDRYHFISKYVRRTDVHGWHESWSSYITDV